jgi:carbonic anhydrase
MPDIGNLISGFRVFKSTTFERKKDIIKHLIEQNQQATTMVISCVDLRISPSEIFATNPGDLYVVNNIGGLVPKYETTGIHGFLSAIEYAVTTLEVKNIIVLGHARCNSIKMMMSDELVASKNGLSESMKTWLSIGSEAREAVKKEMSEKDIEEQQEACGRESLIISLRNLMTYPYIAKRIKQNKLSILGWNFDIEDGSIMGFNADTGYFEPIS